MKMSKLSVRLNRGPQNPVIQIVRQERKIRLGPRGLESNWRRYQDHAAGWDGKGRLIAQNQMKRRPGPVKKGRTILW